MMEKVPYASVAGSLIYTRLDICFAVNLVSHDQSNLNRPHWQAIKRIFQYLCGTTDLTLYYEGGDLQLKSTTIWIKVA